MTEEIKEILDDLGNKDNYIEEFGYQYKRISLFDSFQLLDYITNLQQENETLKDTLKLRTEISTYIANKNDKALKYAKEHRMTFDVNKLINILQGSDEK